MLQAAAKEAVSTLREIAGNDAAPPSARVLAAGKILDLGQVAYDLNDIINRLERLEGGQKR